MKNYYLGFILLLSSTFVFAQRDTIPINSDWLFNTDTTTQAIASTIDFKNATVVNLPHTWNVKKGTESYYGWGYYQHKIKVPKSWKNKNVIIEFGAVNHTCFLFLNGEKIGENIGDGFDKFFINLTNKLNCGKENTFVVAVNNDFGRNKAPFGTSFDWPNDGGIIRPVSIIVSDGEMAKYVHATSKLNTQDSSGSLQLNLGYDNKIKTDIHFNIAITEENQPTNSLIYTSMLSPKWIGNEAVVQIKLPKVHPWHFDFPNLYRIDISVLKGKKAIDKISTNVGFREIKFENGKTYLNEERIKLMGVEWMAGSNPNFGFAEPDTEVVRMGKLLKNVNTIFTRAHFQQGDVFYDFCDRNGVLLQQEIPLWGPETPANDSIEKIATRQLKLMIQNLYNHPSIISWG